VSTFRNQFSKEQFGALMPLLIAHLGSTHVVLHTYAAAAIEKMLTSKVDGPNNTKLPKISGADLKPFLGSLFTGMFTIVDNTQLNENQYVMKCIMRALNVAQDDLLDVVQIVLEKLTTALARVAKNPKDPQFNHYLFESIAVLIRSVCSKDPALTTAFEQFLFPPFQTVLQMEVVEFTPYVFQLLAQILEFRPEGAGLGDAYSSLLPPLLTPTLWERKGNIPALSRLLTAYLSKGAAEIVQQNLLLGILGVFQKLISSKANEQYAFDLLRAIVMYVPQEAFMPRMKDILQILMMRLQQGKTPKFVGLVTHFFALFIGKFGPQMYLDQLNQIQPGLGLMLLMQVWVPRLQAASPARLEAKTQIVGLTKLLCDTPALLADANSQQIWSQVLACVVKIIISPDSHLNALSVEGNDDDAEIGYDATFSVLHFAIRPVKDPFPDVPDASVMLAQSLSKLCATHPGQLAPLIQQGLQSDVKLGPGLESLCQKVGVSLS
jgi:exportin-2 (importin alpha re-exporter)